VIDEIEGVQVGVEGLLLGGEVEPLLGQPLAASDAPGCRWQPEPVSQAELRQAVPVAHAIQARVFTSANEIAGGLKLRARHPDRLEQATGVQSGKLARVPRVGLDAITGPGRHETRRHHLALDPALDQVTVETKTGRPCLIAAAHLRPAAQRPLDRILVVAKRALVDKLVAADRGQANRAGVHVQPDRYRRRVVHGRRPPYVALPGHPRQPTTDA
jgi:hypothetical protein